MQAGDTMSGEIGADLPHPGKDRATIFTVIGVSTLSTAAMVLYPMIVSALGFSGEHAGIFLGGTIHDVAQVVGAGYSLSVETGDVATLVKLMRVAMLLPVIIATTMVIRAKGAGEGERPPILPWFLAVFLGLAALNSFLPVPSVVQDAGGTASRWCLVTAIAALGIKTRFKDMLEIGWKPVVLMIIETLIIAAMALIAIGAGWV